MLFAEFQKIHKKANLRYFGFPSSFVSFKLIIYNRIVKIITEKIFLFRKLGKKPMKHG